jgi:hypothetical protein
MCIQQKSAYFGNDAARMAQARRDDAAIEAIRRANQDAAVSERLDSRARELLEAASDIIDCATMPSNQVGMGKKLSRLSQIVNEIRGE